MSTFETSLTWDEKAFVKGAKLAYDFDMRHTRRRYAGWLFIALTQFGVVGAINHGVSAGYGEKLSLSSPFHLPKSRNAKRVCCTLEREDPRV